VVFGKTGTTLVDLDDIAAGTGGFKIQGENAEDRAGRSVSAAGDVNGDGLDDLIVGTTGNDSGSGVAGAAYVVFGKSGTALVDLDDVAAGTGGFKIQGETAGDLAGWSVSAAGDLNGDGLDDLIVGALGNDTGGDLAGAAYVVFGKSGTTLVDLDDVASGTGGFKIQGETAFDEAGFSVSAAGDVDGDGLDDLIVGAYRNDSGGGNAGAAYVIYGNAAPMADDDSAATPAATVIDVLSNDSDPNGSLVPASVTVASQGTRGQAVANPDGTITYTPNPGESGEDSFTYTVEDDQGGLSDAATVTVTIGDALPQTFTVTNTNDSGVGSLRAAIQAANANPGADTIDFAIPAGSTIVLTSGQLEISGDLTIDGDLNDDRRPDITIDAGGVSRVISIDDGLATTETVTLTGLTITGGVTTSTGSRGDGGGGVRASSANLTLENSTVTGNSTEYRGGGLDIRDGSVATISGCTISGNSSTYSGGGLFVGLATTATVTRSTISDNVGEGI
jgi:hypothetical protein